jgi:hypothetical protein
MKTRPPEEAKKTTAGAKQVHWDEMNRKQRRETVRKIQRADLSLESGASQCCRHRYRQRIPLRCGPAGPGQAGGATLRMHDR